MANSFDAAAKPKEQAATPPPRRTREPDLVIPIRKLPYTTVKAHPDCPRLAGGITSRGSQYYKVDAFFGTVLKNRNVWCFGGELGGRQLGGRHWWSFSKHCITTYESVTRLPRGTMVLVDSGDHPMDRGAFADYSHVTLCNVVEGKIIAPDGNDYIWGGGTVVSGNLKAVAAATNDEPITPNKSTWYKPWTWFGGSSNPPKNTE